MNWVRKGTFSISERLRHSVPQAIHRWPELKPQIQGAGSKIHTGATGRGDNENGAKDGMESGVDKQVNVRSQCRYGHNHPWV